MDVFAPIRRKADPEQPFHPRLDDADTLLKLGFSAVIVSLVVVIAVALFDLSRIRSDLEQVVTVQHQQVGHLTAMRNAARERSMLLHAMIASSDPFERDRLFMAIRERGSRFLEARQGLVRHELTPRERSLLHRQAQQSAVTVDWQYKVIDAVLADRQAEATDALLRYAVPTQDSVMATIDEMLALQGEQVQALRRGANAEYRGGVLMVAVLGGGAVAIGIAVAGLVRRRVRRVHARLHKAKSDLLMANEALEERVERRTRELRDANLRLRREVLEHSEARTRLKEESRRLEEKTDHLERANAELQQFAYVVSHDLKAPLRAVAGLTSVLEEKRIDTSPDERRIMGLIHSRVRRMDRLIDGLLEYTRVGNGRPPRPVAMTPLLDAVIRRVVPPNRFAVHLKGSLPELQAEPAALARVFECLIENAVRHHGGDEGNIWVEVQEHAGAAEIRVTDDGPGIDDQYHQRVLQVFETLDRRDVNDSAGIGLPLAKKLVESNGGSLQLYSTAGRGTQVVFTWPLAISLEPAAGVS